MVEIHPKLKNPDFRFVLLGKWDSKNAAGKPLGKAPFESKWQENGYAFNDPKLMAHPNNVGVIGGYGNLRIRDIDDPEYASELIKANNFDTFVVRTGSGGLHLYYISDYSTNHVLTNGELRANNYQVVIPGSRHPNGNFYEVISDKPIKSLTASEMSELISPFLKNSVVQLTSHVETPLSNSADESRSALEYKKVLDFLYKGHDKESIFKRMKAYAKWAESGEQYREYTFNKALSYFESKQRKSNSYELNKYNSQFDLPEEVQEESVKLEVFTDKDLLTYEPKPQKWLIENAIPAGEIGVLVGKRMERKTFTALHLALCAASQHNAFGVEKVSEKAKVLIATEEDSIDTLATRIKILKQAMGLSAEALEIKYLAFTGVKLDRADKKREAFLQEIEDFKPTLIILDALQRFVTFEIDKDNRSISALFTDLIRPLQQKLGCGWLIIHHMRKPNNNGSSYVSDPLDEVRGGSEIVNYCRYVLMCQKPKNQNTDIPGQEFILFRVLKMSNAAMPEDKVIAYTPSPDGLKVEYIGKPEDILSGEQQAANAIKQYLLAEGIKGEFKTADIINAAAQIGFKKSLLSEGLGVLVQDGTLKKLKRGVYLVIGTGNLEETNKSQTTSTQKREDSEDEEPANEFEGF